MMVEMRKHLLSFRNVPSWCLAWLLGGPGLMPDTPLQSDSATEMLLNASHETSVLLKTVAFQLCLEEPEDLFRELQVGPWEGKETAAKKQRTGMESLQTGL